MAHQRGQGLSQRRAEASREGVWGYKGKEAFKERKEVIFKRNYINYL